MGRKNSGTPSATERNPADDRVRLNRLTSEAEMREVVELQRSIWGYGVPGGDFPYPARALFMLSESGGQVVGAFIDGRLGGFSLAWIGRDQRQGDWYLHSQLLGVLPEFRGLGIGYLLKRAQMDYARELKLDRICWTFDPLRSVNSRLNLHRLGALARRFLPDYYGTVQSHFQNGDPSDRLWAEWYIRSRRVVRSLSRPQRRAVSIPQAPLATEVLEVEPSSPAGSPPLLRLLDYSLTLNQSEVLIEVPRDISLLQERSPDLAAEWREKSTDLFQAYLGRGYIACDLVETEARPRRCFHLLSRQPLEALLNPPG